MPISVVKYTLHANVSQHNNMICVFPQPKMNIDKLLNPGVLVILINTTNQTLQFATVFMKALELTLLSCMSRLAPFFKRTSVASTLLTAAAQWRADFPRKEEQTHRSTSVTVHNKEANFLLSQNK